ncbi:MAG: outer membrane beta-barrel protein [Desulfobacteraceae bacterium]|nr:outer membrane beta-barrel protein [Desulfobacteraceae bacterium]
MILAEGKMILKPSIEAGWQADSNFYKSETNEKEVFTYNIKPGIEFGYNTDKSLVSFVYSANVLLYDDQDDIPAGRIEADEFDYVEHYAFFNANTQATERLLIGLDNLFMNTRDPANADITSNAVNRFKYTMNHFTPSVYYRFGDKFGMGLKYTNFMIDYSDDDIGQGEDSDENRGTFTFFYYFSSKTSFDLDYQMWTRDYDKTTSDYDSHQILVNANHKVNYFTFSAGAGYHNREFEQIVPSGDIDKFIWKFSVSGQNPPEGAQTPKSSMYLAIGSNYNDSGSGDSYFEATRFDARFSHLFIEKINCILTGWFQNSDYESSDREDDRWFISASADYLINDFFSIGMEGGLEDRDSNELSRDFENQYLMVNVKFNYDMGAK